MCDFGESRNVDDLQQRVGRSFNMDQPSAFAEFPRKVLSGRAVDVPDTDLRVLENLRKQTTRSAVNVVNYENLVARFQQTRDCGDRRQSAGKSKSADSVLQFGELLFEDRACGIAAARVVILAEFQRALLLEGRR